MDQGVQLEDAARQQLLNAAAVAIRVQVESRMPDVHWGIGATIGSVIPTKGAIIPAAVGVDYRLRNDGVQTSLNARGLPDNLKASALQSNPQCHMADQSCGRGSRCVARHSSRNEEIWMSELKSRTMPILAKHPNWIAEITLIIWVRSGPQPLYRRSCLDEAEAVWFMLHNGSRDRKSHGKLLHRCRATRHEEVLREPADVDLAYFPSTPSIFDDYFEAWSGRKITRVGTVI